MTTGQILCLGRLAQRPVSLLRAAPRALYLTQPVQLPNRKRATKRSVYSIIYLTTMTTGLIRFTITHMMLKVMLLPKLIKCIRPITFMKLSKFNTTTITTNCNFFGRRSDLT